MATMQFTAAGKLDMAKEALEDTVLCLYEGDTREVEGVDRVPCDWTFQEGASVTARYDYTFEFDGKIGRIDGWLVKRGDTVLWTKEFDDGPYDVLRKGDRITVSASLPIRFGG